MCICVCSELSFPLASGHEAAARRGPDSDRGPGSHTQWGAEGSRQPGQVSLMLTSPEPWRGEPRGRSLKDYTILDVQTTVTVSPGLTKTSVTNMVTGFTINQAIITVLN